MKKLTLLFTATILIIFQACAQNATEAPSMVKTAFSKKFPTAKKAKWDKENEAEWEVEFKMNGNEYSANFTSDGTWKETEHEIKKRDIPADVKQTLDREFAGYDIEEAEISETAEGKIYEFALEKNDTEMEVAISPEGKVIKKEVKKEDKENNGENNEDNDGDKD